MRKIKDIMTDEIVAVGSKDTVYDIALKMKQHDTGFIPVVEGTKLLGVVTDRDLVIRAIAEKKEGSAVAENLMSRDITTVDPETTVDEAAKMMAKDQIRRLPVVDQGELIGVVSIGDLAVRHIFESEAGEALSEISESDKSGTLNR
ncbi:CBS domain-containing protein [Paenibacillus sp. J2TS4]|uniref:CBS domain-containing protein n=1 Tax=Paenibacillus sp. J2TS4 TaxID=2807194 RepID=UPI001B15C738|nr:CBS domain-containing protein [Paenibacillus sp. J2TS4]GIP32922.1 CBS domain-containing protein [Paenibacillus sp. J2TS4]